MKTRRVHWLIGLFSAVLMVATLSPVLALNDDDDDNDEDDGEEQEVSGVFTVDVASSTITIGDRVLIVTTGTEIELEDEDDHDDATLEELAAFSTAHPDAIAEAEFVTENGQDFATEIEVEGDDDDDDDGDCDDGDNAHVAGTLLAIDPNNSTITVQPDGGGAPVVLNVTNSTEFEIDDADLTLAQLFALLQPGAQLRVEVQYDPETLNAEEIHFSLPLIEEVGQVLAVNSRANTLTVKRGRGKSANVKTLPGTVITNSAGAIRLRDLRRGDQVRVGFFMSRRQRVAPRIEVTASRPR